MKYKSKSQSFKTTKCFGKMEESSFNTWIKTCQTHQVSSLLLVISFCIFCFLPLAKHWDFFCKLCKPARLWRRVSGCINSLFIMQFTNNGPVNKHLLAVIKMSKLLGPWICGHGFALQWCGHHEEQAELHQLPALPHQ